MTAAPSPVADSKVCSKCLMRKNLSAFHKGALYKGGVRSQCKECRKNLSDHEIQIRRVANKRFAEKRKGCERLKQLRNDWFKANPDKRRAAKKGQVSRLIDSYVANQLMKEMPVLREEIPQELIELKREQLMMHRAMKKLNEAIDEATKQGEAK